MENTSLIALSRQLVLRRKLDVTANNIANLNTAGFKREALHMDAYPMPVARANTFLRSDRIHDFVEDWTTTTDFTTGTLETTGAPFDMAIEGDGFFTVATPDGERYTRAGHFLLDDTGQLVTPGGYPVLTEGGPITFDVSETDIVIGSDGTISSNAGNRGRLRIVGFDDRRALEKIGDNLFAGANAVPVAEARIRQGVLELSNVEGVVEMTRLIEITRAYEQISRMISSQDELRLKAIERLGDTRL